MVKTTPTLPHPAALGLSLLSVVMVLIALTDTFAEPDLWGYLNFGRLFYAEPGFPHRDALAYVPTHTPWVFHEWLTGVLLYRLQEIVGFGGIQALKYVLGCLTAWMLYTVSNGRGMTGWYRLAPWLLAAAFWGWAFPAFRALCFTYCFFCLFLYTLETARGSENFARLWVLPPVMLLWANLHGGFLAGLGLLMLYAMGQAAEHRRYSPYLQVLAGCLAATLVNPYGLSLWKAVLGHLSQPQHGVREWVSVPGALYYFGASYDLLIFLACLGLAAVLAAMAGSVDRTATLVLGVTAVLGLLHHRHMPFFILAFIAFGPALATRAKERISQRPMARILLIPGLLFAGAMLLFNIQYFIGKTPLALGGGNPLALQTPARPYAPGMDALFYPVGAVDYLEATSFAGKILPYATWGGYIGWRLYPRCRVGMDLRFETVYPKKIRDEYFEFLRCGPRWRDFLTQYPPDAILVYAGDKLAKALAREPGWEAVFQDSHTVLFFRNQAGETS